MKVKYSTIAFLAITALGLGLSSCKEKSPSEKIADGIEDAADEIADGVEDASDDAGDKVEDAVDDVKDAVEDATE